MSRSFRASASTVPEYNKMLVSNKFTEKNTGFRIPDANFYVFVSFSVEHRINSLNKLYRL